MGSVAIIAGYITGIAAAGAVIWKVVVGFHRILEGIRCQLRSEMTKTYYSHLKDKSLREYEYENFNANYKAYVALGGNSFVHHIQKEVETWTVLT